MVEITFLEVHLDSANLTANAPFSSKSNEPEDADEREPGVELEVEDGSGGGGTLLAAVVGLVFLVVVGFLVRRYLRGGELGEIAEGGVDEFAESEA